MPSFSRKETIALSPAKMRMEDRGYVTGEWRDSDVLRRFLGGGGVEDISVLCPPKGEGGILSVLF